VLRHLSKGCHSLVYSRHQLAHDLGVNLILLLLDQRVKVLLVLREEGRDGLIIGESLLDRAREVASKLLLEGKAEDRLKLALSQGNLLLDLLDLQEARELGDEDQD
jgi:hypothetical protein